MRPHAPIKLLKKQDLTPLISRRVRLLSERSGIEGNSLVVRRKARRTLHFLPHFTPRTPAVLGTPMKIPFSWVVVPLSGMKNGETIPPYSKGAAVA